MSENKLGNIINCEVNYDSRIIKDEKAIKQLTEEYIHNIEDFLSHK